MNLRIFKSFFLILNMLFLGRHFFLYQCGNKHAQKKKLLMMACYQKTLMGFIGAACALLLTACGGAVAPDAQSSSAIAVISSVATVSSAATPSSSSVINSSSSVNNSSSSVINSSSSLINSSNSVASSSSVALETYIFEETSPALCRAMGAPEATNLGYSGDGYFNSDNASGAYMTWHFNADKAGTYTLNWRFANMGPAARLGELMINGGAVGNIDFASTGAWDAWQIQTSRVTLLAGDNEISLNATTNAGLANIDWIQIEGGKVALGMCPEVSASCGTSGINSNNLDVLSLAKCKGNPLVCNLGGKVGIYKVSMQFDANYKGAIEVFAESRRKMFVDGPQSNTASRCIDFLVDVRDPEGQPIQDVERGVLGLDLRLPQGGSALTALSVQAVSTTPVIYIAGDSTVADQTPQLNVAADARYSGWGQFIPTFFDDRIAIANYADSGEGSAAFRTDGGGLWKLINNRLKSKDWVMIQLGHNDKTTSGALYRSRVLAMINAIRSKGALPLLVSPMVRNTGDQLQQQHIYGDLNVRNELMALSTSQNVPFIDLMKISSEWALKIGRSDAKGYYVSGDATHSNERGADLFAKMIVDDLRRQNIALATFLRQ